MAWTVPVAPGGPWPENCRCSSLPWQNVLAVVVLHRWKWALALPVVFPHRFNGLAAQAMQAVEDIHDRACYELYADVLLVSSEQFWKLVSYSFAGEWCVTPKCAVPKCTFHSAGDQCHQELSSVQPIRSAHWWPHGHQHCPLPNHWRSRVQEECYHQCLFQGKETARYNCFFKK